MTAALTTLGSGRARTTKPSSPTAATGGRHGRRMPTVPQSQRTAARTNVTLLPETALRWLSPVSSMTAVRSGGVCEVSPTTSAGTSPRASGQRPSVAERNRSRTASAASKTPPGPATTRSVPFGVATATTSSPGSAGPSRTATWTWSCHRNVDQSEPRPMTRTGALTVVVRPRPDTCATSRRTTVTAGAVGRSSAPWPAPRHGTWFGRDGGADGDDGSLATPGRRPGRRSARPGGRPRRRAGDRAPRIPPPPHADPDARPARRAVRLRGFSSVRTPGPRCSREVPATPVSPPIARATSAATVTSQTGAIRAQNATTGQASTTGTSRRRSIRSRDRGRTRRTVSRPVSTTSDGPRGLCSRSLRGCDDGAVTASPSAAAARGACRRCRSPPRARRPR